MTTDVSHSYSSANLTTAADYYYTPPVGNLVFSNLSAAGGQVDNVSSNHVEFFWDQTGDGSNNQLLACIF